MGMKAEEYANKIMNYLQLNGYTKDQQYGCGTKQVRRGIDVPATSADTLLKTLDKLKLLGKVSRTGAKQYWWRLEVTGWDQLDPFADDAYLHGSEAPDRGGPPSHHQEGSESPKREAHIIHEKTDDSEVAHLKKRIDVLEDRANEFSRENTSLRDELQAVRQLASTTVKTLEVKRWDGKVVKLKDVTLPACFQQVLDLVSMRQNVFLVGPSGCGKTYLAKLVADALKMPFGSISCTAGMSESHLLGRAVPDLSHGKNKFQGTEFLELYENGGLFLMDEFDAADPNLLLAVNTAIANDYCNVPNRAAAPKAVRSEDFALVATGNTYGRGANRIYSGRNQIDEATLDRFRSGLVEMDYDRGVEIAVCPDDALREAFWRVREKVQAAGLRRIVSTRAMKDFYRMTKGRDWSIKQVFTVFFNGWTEEEKSKAGAWEFLSA